MAKLQGATIKPAEHDATRVAMTAIENPQDLLIASCPRESVGYINLIQSTFQDISREPICSSSNGFVNACISAYSHHHRLVIRPDDVWLAILTQLNFYVNAHAEELRDLFVDHEGQRLLELRYGGLLHTFDFGIFARDMNQLIQKNIKVPELREWILPDFTTTTPTDTVTCSIVMMSALQQYFTYKCYLSCGIPSVTLLGEAEDWQKLLRRIEKLPEFGEKPRQWYELLKPVLAGLLACFEAPALAQSRDFWNLIVSREGMGSGPSYYTGWITAFCFWDGQGKTLYAPQAILNPTASLETEPVMLPHGLDISRYCRIDSTDVPPGFTAVPVIIDDNGHIINATMVAGSVGIKASASNESVVGPDTLQPHSGWWIFEKAPDEDPKVKKQWKINSIMPETPGRARRTAKPRMSVFKRFITQCFMRPET